MAELFYREDRDHDFLEACETVRRSESGLSIADIVRIAVLKPAKSFYVHTRVYTKVIRTNGKRLPKNEMSKQFHLEVLKRAQAIIMKDTSLRPSDIAKIIAEQSAPRFYISQARAVSLYYELLGQ